MDFLIRKLIIHQQQMIKNIILDFDGTIGDTCSLIVTTMQQTMAALGLPPRTYSECASTIGLPLRQCFIQLLGNDCDSATNCENKYRELFAINNANYRVPVFPHVVETIKSLYAEGAKISIASSRSHQSLQAFLADMKLENYIRCVVAANDVEHAKPAPDMIMKILKDTSGLANETIMVGDTRFDIDMGRNAGTLTCAVTYGNGKPGDFDEADYIIDDFAKLADIVQPPDILNCKHLQLP